MSKTVKVFCDCCGNELNGGIELQNNLFLTIIASKSKIRTDYCYVCGEKIAEAMRDEIRKIYDNAKKGGQE